MAVSITNVSSNPVTLPYPLRGVLRAGAGVVLDATKAQVEAALGDTTRVLEIKDGALGVPSDFHKGDL